jgi:replicative DNA helicase
MKSSSFVVAGAQLRREDKNNEASMESIRESGDIEQDAHDVVVLAEDFAKVVKDREVKIGEKMEINPVKQFIFWETKGECEQNQRDDKGTKVKSTEKKKNSFDEVKNLYKKPLELKG